MFIRFNGQKEKNFMPDFYRLATADAIQNIGDKIVVCT